MQTNPSHPKPGAPPPTPSWEMPDFSNPKIRLRWRAFLLMLRKEEPSTAEQPVPGKVGETLAELRLLNGSPEGPR
jgi:hypothetical protein